MNIVDAFADSMQRSANLPALSQVRRGATDTLTFGEFDERTARLSKQLGRLIFGDRVLVLVPMSIDLYAILMALFRLGLVATFIDPGAKKEYVRQCCRIAQPAALIATNKAHLLRFRYSQLQKIPLKFTPGRSWPWARGLNIQNLPNERSPVRPVERDWPALITFTSGSTGTPKAIVRSHDFLIAQHRVLKSAIRLEPGQCDLATLPIFVLANLASGVHTIIADGDLSRPGFIDPGPILKQIARHRIDRCTASPAFFQRLIERCEKTDSKIESLTQLYTGGAPVFPNVLQRLQEVCPRANIYSVYGSSEAEPIAQMPFAQLEKKDLEAMKNGAGLLAGLCDPQTEVRVIEQQWTQALGPFTQQQFQQRYCPVEQPGEIIVSGHHVIESYLNGTGDSETKIKVGSTIWHRTGDVGYFDRDQRLWLLGRAEARIEDDRGTLYPFAVECAVSDDENVRRSALVESKHKRVLVLESKTGKVIDTQALKRQLRWAEVDRMIVVDRIPVDRRHNAKIDYPALRALIDSQA